MSKKNFKQECSEVVYDLMHSCYDELNLFCEILGYPKSEVNRFIGDDPHGIADIMEGYRYFNMTDIHVVISEYERWMKIYKTNEELRKAVEQWYYYCQEWYNQHSLEEPRWVSVEDRLPEATKEVKGEYKTYHSDEVFVRLVSKSGEVRHSSGYRIRKESLPRKECVWMVSMWSCEHVTHWMPIQQIERSKGCPNLRAWLSGCPVDGLRDATLEWQTQRERDLQAAHQRVEECKQALEDAIKEEVKLNKF